MGTVLLHPAARGRGAARARRCSRSPCAALPADAARRPPGPAQAAPKPRAVVAHRAGAVPLAEGQARAGLRPARRPRPRLQVADADAARARRQGAARCCCPAAGTGRCARRASSTRAGRTSARSSCARRATPIRRRGRRALRVTAVAADSVTVTFGASTDDAAVARYELLAGSGKVLARGAAAPLTAPGPRLRDDLHAARARARRRRPRLAGLARRARAHAPVHRPAAAPDAPGERARDHGRRHERRARLGSGARLRRHRPALRRLPQRRAARPARIAPGFLAAQPRARDAVPLHGRGDRRRQPPLARRRARPHDAGAAARRPGPPTPTCSRRPARASTTCSATTCRSRPSSPTYYHVGRDLSIARPGRPARDRLGAPARHQRRAAHRDRRIRRPAHAARERRPTAPRSSARISAISSRSTATTASTSTSRPAPPTDRPRSRPSRSRARATLHAQGATLTMAVGAKTGATLTGRNGFFDYPALAAICRPPVRDGLGPALGDEPGRPDLGRHLGREDHQLHHDRPERLALHHRHAALRLRLAARRARRRRSSGTT